MDYALQHHKSHIGHSTSELPTPALIVSKSVLEDNIKQLHENVKKLGINFRPHTKTLKTLEVTRLMLKNGRYRKIVCSTIPEIIGSLPLVEEGLVDECLFGMPIGKSVLPRLIKLSENIKVDLLLDHPAQLKHLEETQKVWDVFIKVDVGARRAGLPGNSTELKDLVEMVEASSAANLKGFYCHANHSYACCTAEGARSMLQDEVEGVLQGAAMLPSTRSLIISIGATPTAHVIEALKADLPNNVTLELHAGNFPTNDLQQVSTSLVPLSQQAIRVLAEVVSVYPSRNEALINAGVLSLSRETSRFCGFGKVVDKPNWSVVRVSQEHGIVGLNDKGILDGEERVEDKFKVGDKVYLWVQHSCITAAAFFAYYVVNDEDVVTETWLPWKGW